MSYRRRYRKKRYPYYRRSAWGGRSSKKKWMYQNQKLRDISKALEYKNMVKSGTIGVLAESGTGWNLAEITPVVVQGDDVNERTGTKILAKRFNLNMIIKNNQGTPEDCTIRVIVGRYEGDIDPTHLPTTTDILQDDTSILTFRQTYQRNQRQFKVFFDKTYRCFVATDGHNQKVIKCGWRINDIMRYNSSNESDKKWYVLCVCNASADANSPDIEYLSKMTYLDP